MAGPFPWEPGYAEDQRRVDLYRKHMRAQKAGEEWRSGEQMYQEDPPEWPDRESIPWWRRWAAKIRCWIRKVKAHGARKPE